MRRWLALVIVAVWLIPTSAVAAPPAQAPCEFILGFKTLHDWLGDGIAGTCLENQRFAFNGNAEQLTARGLMAWRKADNWTAFTDGHRTWINGPFGVQERLNTECYPWEVCPATGPPPPVAAPTAVPVATAAPAPTAAPSPTAAPKPGDILYQANWSGGLTGWAASADWKTVGGMLVNDGTGYGSLILAPFQPATPDYAVEAEIQGLVEFGNFGVAARAVDDASGYRGGFFDSGGGAAITGPGVPFQGRQFRHGGTWHTFRLEVKGNTVKLLIDGGLFLERSDNRFLTAGRAGLWQGRVAQFNVRSFKVIAL